MNKIEYANKVAQEYIEKCYQNGEEIGAISSRQAENIKKTVINFLNNPKQLPPKFNTLKRSAFDYLHKNGYFEITWDKEGYAYFSMK